MNPHSDCNYSKQNTLDSRVGGSSKDRSLVDEQSKGVKSWNECFENLLDDPIGLNIFCEFLKREYSSENLYFWSACERYKQIVDVNERKKTASSIFDSYLADCSREPVNVDEKAKLKTQEKLMSTACTDLDLFDDAQRQIFNLMKFDSYTRFIRSDLYKSCVEAENHKQPLPLADRLDPKLEIHVKENGKLTKSEKLSSRKSLLSWHRRRSRCKSNTCEKIKDSVSKDSLNNIHREIESSRSSLSSFDAAISKISNDEEIGNSLCRLILSNGVTTIVQVKPNETIRILVDRLLEKRGMKYNAYDVMFQGTTKVRLFRLFSANLKDLKFINLFLFILS
jgi:regulator of G-protein signaling